MNQHNSAKATNRQSFPPAPTNQINTINPPYTNTTQGQSNPLGHTNTNSNNGQQTQNNPTNNQGYTHVPHNNTNIGGTAQAQQTNSLPTTPAHRYWKLAASESHQPHRFIQYMESIKLNGDTISDLRQFYERI